ncbi:MAG: tryptophan synthase subunit alpha [Candidatus Omnitrophota bacterium]
MNRIEAKFKKLKKEKKKAFIAFITAGYPDLNTTRELLYEFDRIGVDLVELGVPFSDPLADGPLIQEASQAALKKKVNLGAILNLVKTVRKRINLPLCLMTYYNPIFAFGEKAFVKKALESGVDGVIIPDLPPEEGKGFIKLAHKLGLDVICSISPTTSSRRIKYIANLARGFIYYVSLTGVTGPRQNLPAELITNLKNLKKYTSKPICVGFGVSSRPQIEQIYRVADGVIVGSAIIRQVRSYIGKPGLVKKVSNFTQKIKSV